MSTGTHRDCACCGGLADRTPVQIANRPGLPAISYRAGAYAQFRASLIAGLSTHSRSALKSLRTRETDDFSIALLDAWAVAADVITFYTERIANEHYLGTATERGSIAGQAALLGYRLEPGVATSAWLAITAEATPGGPEGSPIPAGTRVQTIPGPGELPQSFETAAPIVAYPAWNRPEIRMVRPRDPEDPLDVMVLAGVETGLRPGDPILLASKDWQHHEDAWSLARADSVDPDPAGNATNVRATLHPGFKPTAAELEVYAFRARSTLFGATAMNPKLLAPEIQSALKTANLIDDDDWAFANVGTGTPIALSASYTGVPRTGLAVLTNPNVTKAVLSVVSDAAEVSEARYAMSAQVTALALGSKTLSVGPTVTDEVAAFGGDNTRSTVVLFGSERLRFAPVPIVQPLWGDRIPLARPLGGLPNAHQVLVRGTRARVQGRPEHGHLEIGGLPRGEDPILISLARLSADPSRVRCVVRMKSGEDVVATIPFAELIFLPPLSDDPVVGEVVTVEASETSAPIDELVLVEPLRNVYSRDAGIELFGNVAAATHGETAPREVLGSGDGARAFQRFTLRKAPLTHVPSDDPGGAASTLEVRVNDIRWHEVPTLFGRAPRDRVYTTSADDDGKVTITFGDGVTGARLPTGFDNVVAHYRTGIGRTGDARAEQIALPVARPLGLKSAVNPLPSTGGQDAQTGADARVNAPRSVLTLGRVVSLQDYADFAADYAGVAKATAAWTWDTRRRGVHVTIASADGQAVDSDSTLVDDVRRALMAVSDPRVPLVVRDFRPRLFTVGAHLRVHSDHDPERVQAAVIDSLVRRYAFDRRDFGEGVSLSELAEAMHRVAGVEGARIDRLHLTDDQASLRTYVTADAPTPGGPPDAAGAVILTLSREDAVLEVDW
ncbi:putative baseplate assembly protein [Microbacterium sp. NPDC019599]|uniref:putative baseplate assembly protein n=1 Tax=Microbacterium sp. NPDC019599 TaxID=3154690 RepID=UPI00340DFEA6